MLLEQQCSGTTFRFIVSNYEQYPENCTFRGNKAVSYDYVIKEWALQHFEIFENKMKRDCFSLTIVEADLINNEQIFLV